MIDPYPDFPQADGYIINDYPGSGYQAKITVSYKTGMQKTFADIRFCDDFGNKIPYWIKSKTDGSTATVQIKLTSSKIVTLRWGNSSAVSESNIKSVFGNSLKAYYPLDGNANDYSGSAYNGTVSGATLTTDEDGVADQAYAFNGANQRISIPDLLSGLDEFTIIIKAKLNATVTDQALLGKWYNARQFIYYLRSGYGWRSLCNNENTETTDTGYTTDCVDANWHKHTITFKKSDYLKVYIDDTERLSVASTALSVETVAGSMYLGLDDDNDKDLNGVISYVLVYSTALSLTDIQNFDVATEPTFTLISSQYLSTLPYEILEDNLTYPVIQFTEDNEMNQPPGTSLDWLVQIRDPTNNGALVTESLTGVSVYYTINKSTGVSTAEAEWTPAPTISAYSNNLTGHLITVPSEIGAYTFVDGDSLIAIIDSDQGTGAILVNFRTPKATLLTEIQTAIQEAAETGGTGTTAQEMWEYADRTLSTTPATPADVTNATSSLATAANLATANANILSVKASTDNLSLVNIKTQCGSAISDAAIVSKIDTVDTVVDGIATTLATPDNFKADVSALATSAEVAAVGAEKIVPADKYAFDASAKTITLASPYDTITVEQVLSIRNLTKNMLLYDCTMTNRSSISIGAGVITHTYSGTMANTDKLMIIVNMA